MDDISKGFCNLEVFEDESQVGWRLVSAESSVVNNEVLKWLGSLAQWRVIPKPVTVIALLICKRYQPFNFMVRESPSFSQIIRNVCLPWDLPLPKQAIPSLQELRSGIPQLSARYKFALIVRERADLLELMSVVHKSTSDYPIRHADGHNYRNSEIASYGQAITRLSEFGVATLRVGRVAHSKLVDAPNLYYDYASSEFRSDAADIAIAKEVDAVISPAIGLDALYEMFNKPIIGVNVPWIDATVRSHLLVMPKHLYVSRSGSKMELPISILTSPDTTWDARHRPIWQGREIQFQGNTPSEITEAVTLAVEILTSEIKWLEAYSACVPLWTEFWSRAKDSHMDPYQRENSPTIIVPESVRHRFT
jgi:putative glycosyltransferase (TIGR04372 family)